MRLAPYTSPIYPPFDLTIPDQVRADAWLTELHGFERAGQMPALEMMHLPSDHTAGPRNGMRTPRACMADNDLALGRIIEGLSRSPFWSSTVVFVLEDDAATTPGVGARPVMGGYMFGSFAVGGRRPFSRI